MLLAPIRCKLKIQHERRADAISDAGELLDTSAVVVWDFDAIEIRACRVVRGEKDAERLAAWRHHDIDHAREVCVAGLRHISKRNGHLAAAARAARNVEQQIL